MTVIVLVGPTSSGKTGLGLELGLKEPKIEIVSADSRQMYKYMDVGTGKAPLGGSHSVVKNDKFWVINGVKVWGYDLISPSDYFSAFDYANFAKNTIADIQKRGGIPLVIGGTGFFIDALTGRVNLSAVVPDFGLRQELSMLSLEEALDKLKLLDEDDYNKIDRQNKIRVIRAIEKRLSPQISKPLTSDMTFNYYGLVDDRANLYTRADAWAEGIWGDLLFDEIKSLVSLGYKDSMALKGLVYKSATTFLNGNLTLSEGLERVKFDLHAYIRRQQTWFKKNDTITWLQVSDFQKNSELLGNALTLG